MAADALRVSWSPLNLFSLQRPVHRREYVLVGLILMPLKYGVEAAAILYYTGHGYSPLDFVNPLLSSREYFAADAPSWFGMAWIVWSLPFLWLAVVLSIRRAYDAEPAYRYPFSRNWAKCLRTKNSFAADGSIPSRCTLRVPSAS